MVDIADTFSETTREGWGSRIGSSIKGMLVGLIMFVISFVVLFWNEGRAVDRTRDLEEGQSVCVAVPVDKIDTANEGKLVHVSAEAKCDESLRDALFEIEQKAIRLRREVEMYQWQEDVHTETKKNVGGSEDKIRTYSYELEWANKFIDSSEFKKPQGHENPPAMPFTTMELDATEVSLGAFKLSSSLIGRIGAWQPLEIDAERFAKLKMPGNLPGRPLDGGIFIGTDPLNLEVGDLRIKFSIVPDTTISLISQQKGESFTAFVTSRGGQIEELVVGDKTKEQMFVSAHQSNTMMTWLVRLGGFLLMLFGLATIGKPLSVLADVLPIAGTIVGVGVGIFAFVAALALSLITIAIAWVFYRPLVGIPLLVVGIALLIFLAKKGSAARAAAAPPAS